MNKSKIQPEIDDNLLWYKDAIIYELHIKAFIDGNNDGIGDFEGLLGKLDYLEDLGVTAIWLLPFYPSPLKDDGYDIQDYYKINPSYGTVKQFKKFVKEAHKRNIRVITELVINHTSDQHPWFKRARKSPKGSVERDYYVWTDDPKKYNGVRIIFQDYESSNWTYDPIARQYYWHRFFHHQPDLNYDNPKVQEEVFKIIDYWAGMGVDGFRLDAVPYLYQREGTNCENLPETHQFLKKLRQHIDEKFSGKMLLAEANMWPEDSASYFGNGDECHMNYHFPIMPRMFMAMRMENRYPITDIFEQTPDIPYTCQWAIFLRNHDELTLEMVTDEERDYMYKVYAENPKAKINLGLRRRLAPLMDNNRQKIELINTLLYSLPGTPVIYYGDEIGMGDNFYLGDRDGVRTPMQWSPDRNGGFSHTNPQELYLPMILDPEYHFESVNVEMQQSNGSSLLWWTKRMINMRKKFKAFSRGTMEFIHTENSKVLAFIRAYEDEIILVVVNLSRYSEAAELELNDYAGYYLTEVYSKNKFPVIKENQDYLFTLSPHAYHWFQLQNEMTSREQGEDLPEINLDSLKEIVSDETLQWLEDNALLRFFTNSSWYKSKEKKIERIKVLEKIPVKREDSLSYLLILELNFESGLPDFYQTGLAFGKKNENKVLQEHPEAIIAEAMIGDMEGYLYDGLFDPMVQEFLFKAIAQRKKIKSGNGIVKFFDEKKKVSKYVKKHKEVKARMTATRHSNTSLIYNNDYYLKIYRKLDRAINPDLEIIRFAVDEKGFKNIPDLMGTIQLEYSEDDSIVLGMLQKAVDYQNDAWNYLLDFFKRYINRIQLKAKDSETTEIKLKGSLVNPITLEQLDDPEMLELLGVLFPENMKLLGKRTAELHQVLASDDQKPDFSPEEFSLHYQRSLFSSFQQLIRHTFQTLNKKLKNTPEIVQMEAKNLLPLKQKILDELKKVYENKLDINKIRAHGDFHLKQVLFTGQDFIFIDFEGENGKSYSERRLKRSPLRDLASMIWSFFHVAYEGILANEEIREKNLNFFKPWATKWYHYMSQFFMESYISNVEKGIFIPDKQEDFEKILKVFMLERAVIELEFELKNPSERILIPILGIKSILDPPTNLESLK
ncbi:maltose alpha-D-glucosyltransferase [Flexithrix dorotheae]|uniref:maltose alpha-D-glucosyltransferase n=1 Tax=Flexithrix dorotheae TaxID=70993 RepID=UPI00037DBE08